MIRAGLAALALAALGAVAFAQAPGGIGTLDPRQAQDDRPVEITANDGIEWDRAGHRYLARGDARVVRGDTSVQADLLIAHYRAESEPAGGTAPAQPGGGNSIYRYEAVGNVRVATPTQTIVADRADYDVAGGRIVLTGRALRLTTPGETVTARDALEYHDADRRAVARGDAVVVTRDGRRLRADLLTAYLYGPDEPRPPPPRRARAPAPQAAAVPGADSNLKRAELEGNVVIATPAEMIRGNRAVYDARTGIALIVGAVQLTRGANQLSGERVEVNLNSGISRLLPGGDGRARALLVPGGGTPRTGAPR